MNNLRIKKLLALGMTVLLALGILQSIAGPVRAQENRVAPGEDAPAATSQPQGPTDPAELEAFLNDLIGKEMAQDHIAGATVSVVKDGKLFFTKGYGYADIEQGIPVDPEQTGFKIGSLTKLFTWTAVMQLVEQGRLDLDADINTYLDFHIPDTYPQPITLKHLMTHTAGFEDLHYETLAVDANHVLPAREWLASHIPARVRKPGDSAAYSNYGAALAGYILERVSGQPYGQYIQEHILNPLGMAHTTVSLTLPPDQRTHLSVGYAYMNGALLVFPDIIGQWAILPEGGMTASATDMARFMIAQLQNGRYSDANIAEVRILKEATAQQMHSTAFTPTPLLLGTAYGFFDFSDNGQHVIGHSGEAEPMQSLLLLLPDQNLGIFVSYNSLGAGELINQHFGFQRAFFDHYYPAPAVKPIQPRADFAKRAGRFVGKYRVMRSSYTTLEKVTGLMGSEVDIRNPGDGTLLMITPWETLRLAEVEPLTFRQVDGPYRFAFREDSQGRITHLFTDLSPQYAFDKLSWYETSGFNLALLLGCVVVFVSLIPVRIIGYILNRRSHGDRKPTPRGARVARWSLVATVTLNLIFVAGTLQWASGFQTYGVTLGISMFYKIVLGLGVLSAALTAGALIYMVLAWKNSYWGIAARGYYTLVTVAAVAFVWFLNYWNLLGWRF